MKRLVSFIGFLAIIFISSCEEENLPPYGTIITPVDGEEYNQGDEIQIKIDATDPDGSIEEVDFFSFNEKETSERLRGLSPGAGAGRLIDS